MCSGMNHKRIDAIKKEKEIEELNQKIRRELNK